LQPSVRQQTPATMASRQTRQHSVAERLLRRTSVERTPKAQKKRGASPGALFPRPLAFCVPAVVESISTDIAVPSAVSVTAELESEQVGAVETASELG